MACFVAWSLTFWLRVFPPLIFNSHHCGYIAEKNFIQLQGLLASLEPYFYEILMFLLSFCCLCTLTSVFTSEKCGLSLQPDLNKV